MHQLLFGAPLLWAVCDRLWGASRPAFKGKKAVIALASIGGGYLLAGPTGALFGLAWLIWRSVPFFGGSGAPQTAHQRVAAVLRHLPIVLPVALIAYWRGLPEPQTAGVFALYAAGAIGLSLWYGEQVSEAKARNEGIGSKNVFVEAARGALFGLAVIVSSVL